MCTCRRLLRAFCKLFCLQFCVSCDQRKNTVQKILPEIWKIFFYESNCNHNSCKFSYKFAFFPFVVHSLKPKVRIKISTGSWFGDEKYFCFGNMNFKCWRTPNFCHIRDPVLLPPLSGDHIFMISNWFLTID